MTTNETWKIGDHYFVADGEQAGLSADFGAADFRTFDESAEEARTWLAMLTDSERRTARAWVREMVVTAIDDDGEIGCGSSIGQGVFID